MPGKYRRARARRQQQRRRRTITNSGGKFAHFPHKMTNAIGYHLVAIDPDLSKVPSQQAAATFSPEGECMQKLSPKGSQQHTLQVAVFIGSADAGTLLADRQEVPRGTKDGSHGAPPQALC